MSASSTACVRLLIVFPTRTLDFWRLERRRADELELRVADELACEVEERLLEVVCVRQSLPTGSSNAQLDFAEISKYCKFFLRWKVTS